MARYHRCLSALLLAALCGRARAGEPARVELGGYLQADGTLYDGSSEGELDPSTREPLNDERFQVRRARVRARAERGVMAGLVELDGSTARGPAARLVAADVTASWRRRLAGTLGLMKIPFGADTQLEPHRRLFLEPATFVRALFPGERDVGVRVQGAFRALRAQLAVMNGEPIGERSLPGRDPNAGKDIMGRIGVETPVAGPVALAAGVSGLRGRGFHPGTPGTKDTLTWRDSNENGVVEITELQVIAGSAASPSADFDRFALGADLAVTVEIRCVGTLTAAAELVWAENLDRGLVPADPVARPRDVRELGWSVAVTQELYPHALIGLRYDRYDPDADAREQQGATLVPRDSHFATLSAVAAWTYHDLGRVTLEYDHNDNRLGRDAAGKPVRLADDALTVRAQVKF